MLSFVRAARLISSELAVTEVTRAARREPGQTPPFVRAFNTIRAEILLEEVALHPIDRLTLWRAGRRFDPNLGSFDAIHVMTALDLRPIEAFVTYDKHQATVAHDAGLPVRSPGA
jgi:predicted nucleic acid-binding protein